jgi:hypothetical protein
VLFVLCMPLDVPADLVRPGLTLRPQGPPERTSTFGELEA